MSCSSRGGRLSRVVVAAVVFGACAGSGTNNVVEYSARDLDSGAAVSVEEFRGSPVLLASWATWCEPCKTEMPALQALYEQRHPDGLEMVAVNVNAAGPDEDRIEPMAKQWGLTMQRWRDTDNEFTARFDGIGVPMSVLLDANGRLIHTWHGAVDPTDGEFQATIDEAIAST